MKFRDWLEPAYDPRPWKEIPKVRGVLFSLIIATIVWFLAAHILGVALFAVVYVICHLASGVSLLHFGISPHDYILWYGSLLSFALFIEFFSHGTAYICFLCCRTWTSLTKAVLFPMIGRRYYSGSGTNDAASTINRINILGY